VIIHESIIILKVKSSEEYRL